MLTGAFHDSTQQEGAELQSYIPLASVPT